MLNGMTVLVNGSKVATVTRHINHSTRHQWWLDSSTTRPEPMSPTGVSLCLSTAFIPKLHALRREIAKRFPGSVVRYHYGNATKRQAA